MTRTQLIQKMIEAGKTIGMLDTDFYTWMDGLDTYPQGTEALQSESGFCCLGVEQKVRMGRVEYDYHGDPDMTPSSDYLTTAGVVYLVSGESSSNPECRMKTRECGRLRTFADMNDSSDYTFAQLKPLLIESAFLYCDPLEPETCDVPA